MQTRRWSVSTCGSSAPSPIPRRCCSAANLRRASPPSRASGSVQGAARINDFVNAVGAQAVGIGLPEVYTALERGTVDCAITGTGTGNNVKWYEVTKGIYNLTIGWSTAAYFVNLAWWNKLDPQLRNVLEDTMKEVEDRQWSLADSLTAGGIACNIGDAAKCRGGTVVTKNPMTVQEPTAADQERVRTVLAQNILPTWIKRCGAQCGEVYNRVVAPISGVRMPN